jgi:Immunoglobulin domain
VLLAVPRLSIAQPTITTQPKRQSASLGAKVTFNVRASGTSPLGYQWQPDDTVIPEATGVSLVLTNLQLASAGHYTAIVTAGGSVRRGCHRDSWPF